MSDTIRPRVVIVAAAFLLWAGVCLGSGPVNMIHGQPAFDSGWRDIGGTPLQVYHNLGGNIDDYVVDVQLRDLSGEGNLGVHQRGFGGDRHGSSAGDIRGVSLIQLTSTRVTLLRNADEDHVGQVRVRLWIVPEAAYDSGWQAIGAGATRTFTHGVGGDPDDYVVDLTFKDGSTVNKDGYGLDRYPAPSTTFEGAYWYDLGPNTVKVRRGEDDTGADQVRLRVFRRPSPSWDSGWQAVSPGSDLVLAHNLGGPWNDLYVDLQLDDTNNGLNVNQRGLGGDKHGSVGYGAYWFGLTGSRITVSRMASDTMADRVRVRLWASRVPAYDSGWRPIAPGTTLGLAHSVRGDSDTAVVDLQFKDADGTFQAGVNTYKYGGDVMYNMSTSQYDERGAAWRNLGSSNISVYRWPDDPTADQVRLRMWQAVAPDYDSGWRSISQGQTLSLNHGVGGSTSGYVVDLQLKSPMAGVHHVAFGQDQFFDTGVSAFVAHGAYWRALTNSSVDVRRMADDQDAHQVRLRIWRDTVFDDGVSLIGAPAGPYEWTHNLGVDPDQIVVYQSMRSSSATFGVHQYRLGGDRVYYGGWQRYGAWWENLTSTGLTLWRALEDSESDDIMVRLWWTGSADVLFADGFESGNTARWASTTQ